MPNTTIPKTRKAKAPTVLDLYRLAQLPVARYDDEVAVCPAPARGRDGAHGELLHIRQDLKGKLAGLRVAACLQGDQHQSGKIFVHVLGRAKPALAQSVAPAREQSGSGGQLALAQRSASPRIPFLTILWCDNTTRALVTQRTAAADHPWWTGPTDNIYHVYVPAMHDWRPTTPGYNHAIVPNRIIVLRRYGVVGVDEAHIFHLYFQDIPPTSPVPLPVQVLPTPPLVVLPAPAPPAAAPARLRRRLPSPPPLVVEPDSALPTVEEMYRAVRHDTTVTNRAQDNDGDAGNNSDSDVEVIEVNVGNNKRRSTPARPSAKRPRLVIDVDVANIPGPSSLIETPTLSSSASASTSASSFSFPPSPA